MQSVGLVIGVGHIARKSEIKGRGAGGNHEGSAKRIVWISFIRDENVTIGIGDTEFNVSVESIGMGVKVRIVARVNMVIELVAF